MQNRFKIQLYSHDKHIQKNEIDPQKNRVMHFNIKNRKRSDFFLVKINAFFEIPTQNLVRSSVYTGCLFGRIIADIFCIALSPFLWWISLNLFQLIMERQREYFSVLKKIKSHEVHHSRLLMNVQTKPLGVQHSMGKSIKNIKVIEKIAIIKNTCLHQSVKQSELTHSPTKQKSYSLANQQDLDTSVVISDQEDNAEYEIQSIQGTVLLNSKFKNRPKTILFRYPTCCQKQHNERLLQGQNRIVKGEGVGLKYRIYGSEYKCIVNAFEFNGFRKGETNNDWHVFFDVRGSKIKSTYNKIVDGQKFNHFAGCWHLGRKDQLWRAGYKQRKLFPQDYHFLPKTFIFPFDFQRFQTTRQMYDKTQLWIQKPVASSKGRNIKVMSNSAKIYNRKNTLVSEYIDNPHLINNLKYDLRIYVLVTSFNPLKIYIYQNGLARFATGEYKTKGKKDKFIHLTNFSVNKHSKNFVQNRKSDNPEDDHTSKWSLTKLKEYYSKIGIDYTVIFKQVEDIVIKTCISAESSILAPKYRFEDKRTCGFELYGFDILIDDKLKAWLMEVNVCPSLCSSSPFDRKIKHTLIVDLLNLVGISEPEENSDEKSPKQEGRKYRFKNPNSILNLNFDNCLELLAPEDWLILFEHQEQLDRMSLGSFQRAFPRKDNIGIYQKFFDCARYNNFVLWKHILSPKSFINQLNI